MYDWLFDKVAIFLITCPWLFPDVDFESLYTSPALPFSPQIVAAAGRFGKPIEIFDNESEFLSPYGYSFWTGMVELRRRYTLGQSLPYLRDHKYRLPDNSVCEANRSFAWNHSEWVLGELPFNRHRWAELEEWHTEAMQRYHIWGKMAAITDSWSRPFEKRQLLRDLIETLGPDQFNAGVWPAPAPLHRFRNAEGNARRYELYVQVPELRVAAGIVGLLFGGEPVFPGLLPHTAELHMPY